MKKIAFALTAVALLAVMGCNTPQRKTIAITEASVDKAMFAWGDYVKWQKSLATPDEALPGQEAAVRQGFSTYRQSMNIAYDAEKTYSQDKAAGLPAWRQAMNVALGAANSIIILINQFLPPEKRIPSPSNP